MGAKGLADGLNSAARGTKTVATGITSSICNSVRCALEPFDAIGVAAYNVTIEPIANAIKQFGKVSSKGKKINSCRKAAMSHMKLTGDLTDSNEDKSYAYKVTKSIEKKPAHGNKLASVPSKSTTYSLIKIPIESKHSGDELPSLVSSKQLHALMQFAYPSSGISESSSNKPLLSHVFRKITEFCVRGNECSEVFEIFLPELQLQETKEKQEQIVDILALCLKNSESRCWSTWAREVSELLPQSATLLKLLVTHEKHSSLLVTSTAQTSVKNFAEQLNSKKVRQNELFNEFSLQLAAVQAKIKDHLHANESPLVKKHNKTMLIALCVFAMAVVFIIALYKFNCFDQDHMEPLYPDWRDYYGDTVSRVSPSVPVNGSSSVLVNNSSVVFENVSSALLANNSSDVLSNAGFNNTTDVHDNVITVRDRTLDLLATQIS